MLARPPRLLPGLVLELRFTPPFASEKAGIFATRGPKRPNPIGLSVVAFDGFDGAVGAVQAISPFAGGFFAGVGGEGAGGEFDGLRLIACDAAGARLIEQGSRHFAIPVFLFALRSGTGDYFELVQQVFELARVRAEYVP